jgi:lipoprotein-releasing system permease protein
MFEFSVACKYLLPRRRQLSVSIISTISVLVIALVVWLIVVFFSVTDGLEKNWVHKLIALTAPIRVTPTEAYYNSYYYQVDSISYASDYNHKTIAEKKETLESDPYDESLDEEISPFWPLPDRQANGRVKDLVKLAYQAIEEMKDISGLKARDFELTFSHLHLRLLRESALPYQQNVYTGVSQSVLSYPTYLGNFEGDNHHLAQTILPITMNDLDNLLSLMGFTNTSLQEETEDQNRFFEPSVLHKRLANYFEQVKIKSLQTRSSSWMIPRFMWPEKAQWAACFILKGDSILRIVVPTHTEQIGATKKLLEDQGLSVTIGQVFIEDRTLFVQQADSSLNPLPSKVPLTLATGSSFPARLMEDSILKIKRVDELKFHIQPIVQGFLLDAIVPLRGLQITEADIHPFSPLWIYSADDQFILPRDQQIGDGILLPKSFKDGGVCIGDRGYLTYLTPTASMLQEQRLPIYVAGFYDPGIIPIGGKFILVNKEISTLIRSAHQQDQIQVVTNGINVHFDQLDQTELIKSRLIESLKQKEVDRYWKVESYKEYEFTKEIMGELQSQKSIFSLIAVVIIIVACSNIISMLIILVNDKKTEIGILRSMGASSKSIAFIFGLAGGIIGVLGSMIGIATAILTLRYLEQLIKVMSYLQGQDVFSTTFYGEFLPQELSYEALSFVFVATVAISLLAGIIPAVKACLLKPANILRSAGV